MTTATIKITGLKEAIKEIEGLDNLVAQLARPTRDVLEMLRERLQEYPPAPAGSTYVRTFALKNGWQELLVLSGNRLGLVENPVAYAPYVQDPDSQAAVHAGRWQTTEDVAREKEAAAAAIYEDYIQGLING